MFRALGLVSKKALLAVTWQAQTASNALRLKLFRESAEEISWYNKGSREGGEGRGLAGRRGALPSPLTPDTMRMDDGHDAGCEESALHSTSSPYQLRIRFLGL